MVPERTTPARISNRLIGRRTSALIALAVLLFLPLSLLLYLHSVVNVEPLPVGEPIPSLQLSTLQRTPVLLKTYEGKKLVLLFFTAECSHCQRELSNLEYLYEKYKEKLQVLSISHSDEEATRELISERRLSFPVLLDEKKETKQLFRMAGVPALFLVDERQILRYRRFGERSLAVDELLLNDFVSGKLSAANDHGLPIEDSP
jgi:peroxiredoxin